MNFEELLITDMKKLDENFFIKRNNNYLELSHQLNVHAKKPFIPSWAHKRMLELRDKNTFDNTVKNSPIKVVHPLMSQEVKNVGEKRVGSTRDISVNVPIVIHNTRTGEMHLIAGNHKIESCNKTKTNTPVIAIPHEE